MWGDNTGRVEKVAAVGREGVVGCRGWTGNAIWVLGIPRVKKSLLGGPSKSLTAYFKQKGGGQGHGPEGKTPKNGASGQKNKSWWWGSSGERRQPPWAMRKKKREGELTQRRERSWGGKKELFAEGENDNCTLAQNLREGGGGGDWKQKKNNESRPSAGNVQEPACHCLHVI